ncbi:hypothetical protein F5I97DRAFT_1814548 [Phlebopus sp. FC_14]|nr:hypothetical protein F5I97DRAFT_1814548 [Phlebopus sp. FC_14]
MSKSEREEAISSLTAKIFSVMLDELALDAALQAHHEIARTRVLCHICHARNNGQAVPSQFSILPNGEASMVGDKTVASTGTNTPVSIKDGNVLFECTMCKRQIASNRYAPHLSSCMGIGTGRRGAARGANLRTKTPVEPRRSASPYLGSDGNVSDENSNGKGKGKSKGKLADEAEFNLKRKRPVSPQTSPVKKQKKQKMTGVIIFLLSQTLQVPSSQTKIPSKLRASSTASFVEQDRSSTPGSQSSAGTPIATSASSAVSAQSPAGTGPPKRGRPKGSKTGMGRGAVALATQAKRPSPPRPPPPPVRIEPDYLVGESYELPIDVEGEETGSSTDTDT